MTDIDWVVIGGSLLLGSTQRNVFLAHYNVGEDRADEVAKQLASRLPKGKQDGKGLTAEIDGAPRAYLRPKPGLLAIVPPEDAKRIADALARADVPATVRPNELLRIVWNGRRHLWATYVPHAVRKARAWIRTDEQRALQIGGEGDCDDDAAAADAVREAREQLELVTRWRFVRLLAGRLIDPSDVWADGRTLRYDAPLDVRILDVIGQP